MGNRARSYGINVIGLERKGFDADAIRALKHAYRVLFRARLPLEAAIQRLRQELPDQPDVQRLTAFITNSQRGVIR